jgi:DnaJ-class molecular chaperone
MPRRVKCHCGGRPSCRLCNGTGFYEYEPGPRGWMPFKCPTCDGTGQLEAPDDGREKCFTCLGQGTVDPANPPPRGIFDVIWKALFGA